MKVTILGCGSATPSISHMPSSQIVEHNEHLYMIDCGEGTQLQLARYHIRIGKLNRIFISHLHGDHMLGLVGLLSSLTLHDFGGTLHVHIHAAAIPVIAQSLKLFSHTPSYDLQFHGLPAQRQVIFEDKALEVEAFPLHHQIPCMGFIFREKPKPLALRGDMAEYYNIPFLQRAAIKEGADFVTADGTVVENRFLTLPAPHSVSYAYASDTIPHPEVANAVRGVDLLYHEATYGDDKAPVARARGHSTARQAAEIAAQAGVKQLMIGHFSKSYNGRESALLAQARDVFPNTILANEGLSITL